jgi:hypothetical protein
MASFMPSALSAAPSSRGSSGEETVQYYFDTSFTL